MHIFRYILTYCALCCAIAVSAQPKAEWLQKVHDFGAFDEDMGPVTSTFQLVNTGTEPLVIMAARATCGCTVPSYTHDPIAPGDTAIVEVTYNPAGRPGKFDKRVKIETNTLPAQSVITIKGVVIGATKTLRAHYPVEVGKLKIRNTALPFGEITKGRTKTAFLDGYNQSNDTIRPRVEGLPEYIDVNIAPKEVPPGEQLTFTFFFNSAKAPDWGLTTANAVIYGDTGETSNQSISLIGIVNEDFSNLTEKQRENAPRIAVSESAIDLGRIERGLKHIAEISIDNYGKDPLIIRKISCADPEISFKLNKEKVKHGANARLTVTVDTSKVPEDVSIINSKLIIITNDPQRPQSSVRIVGEFIK
ncbi:MAG: DUF1573 domain-containing protein [Muribaculum sp.]|nr:DUF1573 domain-containing protein [Muribaculum sp.]